MPGATYYAISDTITITVQNTTGRTIYARTSFTGCSIIALAYRTGSSWQPIHLCADGIPHPSITQIAPGGKVAIKLAAATASSDANGGETAQWPVGTYRASLTYTTSADGSFSRGTTTYSSTFVVGG